MENILKLILSIAFIIFVGFLVHQISVQANSDTYVRLTNELAEVRAGNEQIAARNELLQTRIDALRSDPRAIERKVRDELGMARPDEVIILLKDSERDAQRKQLPELPVPDSK
ncbi:MAG: septum formation initiator family protein [Proteobacteria bacterium]|nr:septum formation initiator family protein [Pseudomonadota bacterium]